MKQLCGSVLAVGLLLLAATAQAQAPSGPGALASVAPAPCGIDVSALRGTYAFTATAWQDLSEMDPALPKGYAPVTILGAFKVAGNGDVTGWASVNTGGLRLMGSSQVTNASTRSGEAEVEAASWVRRRSSVCPSRSARPGECPSARARRARFARL